MKTLLLVTLLLGLIYYRYQNSGTVTLSPENTVAAQFSHSAAARTIVVASAPSSYDRWKIGPSAQTDLKIGPNAQTNFAAFAPSEQADWNLTPGYTIVAPHVRIH